MPIESHRAAGAAGGTATAPVKSILVGNNTAAKSKPHAIANLHFSKRETRILLNLFKALCQGEKRLSRTRFRDILHNTFNMNDDLLRERVFRVCDKDNDSMISSEEWLECCSLFLRGTLGKKIKFCFKVYDLNDDGRITKEEMFLLLKHCSVKQSAEEDTDEGARDMIDLIVKLFCKDKKKTNVELNAFRMAVIKDPLLLEFLGYCLPEEETVNKLKQLFKPARANQKSYGR